MIKDIEEESKTKFSIKVEFSFSFKAGTKNRKLTLQPILYCVILYYVILFSSLSKK